LARAAATAPYECAGRLRTNCSGYDAHACASGPARLFADCRRKQVPDSVRFSPLHFTPLRSRARPRRPCAGRSAAFRSATRIRRRQGRDARCARPLRGSSWGNQTNPQTRQRGRLATRRGWHEGPADATLLTALRGWASALLPAPATRAVIFKAAPAAVSASGASAAGSPPSPRVPARRPGSLRYNCVLWPERLLPCHGDCFPDSPSGTRLPSPRGSQRARSQASFTPTAPLRR
jgi:hypothetical protein